MTLQVVACSVSPQLTVHNTANVDYQCEQNKALKIRYFTISDGSLSFVKFQLGQEPEITLPQFPSASGAMYTNGSIKWWSKGNTGSLQVQEAKDSWLNLYSNCNAF